MIIANLRHLARTGEKPARTTTFVFFADEEAGGLPGQPWSSTTTRMVRGRHRGRLGGRRLQRHRASGRNGGADPRLPRADRGEGHRLAAPARPRAGRPRSVPTDANARRPAGRGDRPDLGIPLAREYIASVRALLDGLSDLTGTPYAPDDPTPSCATSAGRPASCSGTLSGHGGVHDAGRRLQDERHPADRVAHRWTAGSCPGHEDDLMATVRELAGEHVEVVVEHRDIALDSPLSGDLFTAMTQSLLAEDPDAAVLPYCLSGGPTTRPSAGSGSPATGSRPSGCPPTSTSRRCSTGSTSGFRWSR